MIDFHNEDLRKHANFSEFSKVCRMLRGPKGDTLLIDMVMETLSSELQEPALLHAYWLAANFNIKKLLAYTEEHGIHQKHPGLYQDIEIANRILRNFFRNRSSVPQELLDVLKKTTCHHGADYAVEIIDLAFTPVMISIDHGIESARLIISEDLFRSAEIGNYIICRLADFCEREEPEGYNKQISATLDSIRECEFDDIGSLSVILSEDTVARSNKVIKQLSSAFIPTLRLGLNHERKSILPIILEAMPIALLNEVMSFNDSEFKKLVRGPFLDCYLAGGWMKASETLSNRYSDQAFTDLILSFNQRMMKDDLIRSKIEHHSSVTDCEFEGLESLYIIPELLKYNIQPSIEENASDFAKLVNFSKGYEPMRDMYEAGIQLIKITYSRIAEKLYDELYENVDFKIKLKPPAAVTSDYKLGQMAVMLMCEKSLRGRIKSDEIRHKLAPIDLFLSKNKSKIGREWVDSNALATYARSLPEAEVLNAAGKRKNYIKFLVDSEVLGKEHYAKLPIKDRGAAFIKELGV